MIENYFFILKRNGRCIGGALSCSYSCGPVLAEFCHDILLNNGIGSNNEARKEFVITRLIDLGYAEKVFEVLL